MSFKAVIAAFQEAIAPDRTTIYKLPPHILVFGGTVSVGKDRYASSRKVLLAVARELRHPLSKRFHTPEDYSEWNRMEGYHNLVEFEIDAGCLASAIVLLTETSGAIAELGAFCMEETLRERLLVVINREQINAEDSFIFLGPIKLITRHCEDHSICAVETLEDPSRFENEVPAVLETLEQKLESEAKHPQFFPQRRRDRFLLVADLIDLFRALNANEIINLLATLSVAIERHELERILWMLRLFGFLRKDQVYGTTYYVAIKGADHQYLDFTQAEGQPPFSRQKFKVRVQEALDKDSRRKSAYNGNGSA